MNRTVLIFVVIISSLTALPLSAQSGAQSTDHNAHHPETKSVAKTTGPMTDGEIRKVDMDAKKITIRHGAIENLGMPPMTMVFQVKDPALLDKAKTGDKVKFTAEKTGGAYTVTQIEPAK